VCPALTASRVRSSAEPSKGSRSISACSLKGSFPSSTSPPSGSASKRTCSAGWSTRDSSAASSRWTIITR